MTSIEASQAIDKLLSLNGKLRSNELKSEIVRNEGKSFCAERTFYKILSQKISAGLIRKIEVNKYEIWYEWIGFTKDESKFEQAFNERLSIMDENIKRLETFYSKLKTREKAKGILHLFNDLDYLETTVTMFLHSVSRKRSKVLRNLMENEFPKRTKIILNFIMTAKEASEIINLNAVSMGKNLLEYENFILALEKYKKNNHKDYENS